MISLVLSLILLIAYGWGSAPVHAQSVDIDSLYSAYESHLKTFPGTAATLIENSQWQSDQVALIRNMAQAEFSLFLSSNQKPTLLDRMIDPLDHAEFNEALNAVALDDSIQYLKQSPSSDAVTFLADFIHLRTNQTFAFNLVQSSDFLNSQMPAGYVRGEHMVLMKYDELDRNSWLAIFIHELCHYLDQKLTNAVNDGIVLQNEKPDVTKELVGIGQKYNQGVTISPDEAALVDRWISLALERGMMAEIRAWTRTYALYLDLRSENLIGPVKWADEILSQKVTSESMSDFCKRYFDALYAHPTDGMWTYPYLKNRLETIRSEKLKE